MSLWSQNYWNSLHQSVAWKCEQEGNRTWQYFSFLSLHLKLPFGGKIAQQGENTIWNISDKHSILCSVVTQHFCWQLCFVHSQKLKNLKVSKCKSIKQIPAIWNAAGFCWLQIDFPCFLFLWNVFDNGKLSVWCDIRFIFEGTVPILGFIHSKYKWNDTWFIPQNTPNFLLPVSCYLTTLWAN